MAALKSSDVPAAVFEVKKLLYRKRIRLALEWPKDWKLQLQYISDFCDANPSVREIEGPLFRFPKYGSRGGRPAEAPRFPFPNLSEFHDYPDENDGSLTEIVERFDKTESRKDVPYEVIAPSETIEVVKPKKKSSAKTASTKQAMTKAVSKETKDAKGSKGSKDVKNNKEAKDAKDAKAAKVVKDTKVAKISKAAKDTKVSRDAKVPKDVKVAKDAKGARVSKYSKDAKDTFATKSANDSKDVNSATEAQSENAIVLEKNDTSVAARESQVSKQSRNYRLNIFILVAALLAVMYGLWMLDNANFGEKSVFFNKFVTK